MEGARARVKPPMKESRDDWRFLQAKNTITFTTCFTRGKTFAEVIKVGEMVENGIKSGKNVSQAALKATTQVLQNGSGNIRGKKRREDVATVMSNPPPRNLDYSQHCAYYSDAPRHNIERCWYLKKAIQDLIDTRRIIVESPNGPNINQNPLPRHTETNMLEMMNDHEEVAVPYKPILKIETDMESSANVVDLTKMMLSGAKSTYEKLTPSSAPILA
ncbi:hypothetical protein H5410_022439 [Solanum commersonii]|uniref:Gag-pol polyprotein n=1 Tax=Solanum commersonii TaxID=4109 RepID=A0A9J5ZJA6_SOLCO|nr:hypothetical protein H5410_022439 [Solanum commersonii]